MMGGHLTWTPPTLVGVPNAWGVFRGGRMVAVTLLGADHAEALADLCRSWQPHVPADRWTVEAVDLRKVAAPARRYRPRRPKGQR